MLESKKNYCSIKHFEVLLKQFKKITTRVVHDHEFEENYDLFSQFLNTDFNAHCDNLLSTFKSNMFKTKSCFYGKMASKKTANFWVSYTFEDNVFKRTANPNKITFRVFCRIGGYKKKLLVRWSVPLTN